MTKKRSSEGSQKKAGEKKKRATEGGKGVSCGPGVTQYFHKLDAIDAVAGVKEDARSLYSDHVRAVNMRKAAGVAAYECFDEYTEAAMWVGNLAGKMKEIVESQEFREVRRVRVARAKQRRLERAREEDSEGSSSSSAGSDVFDESESGSEEDEDEGEAVTAGGGGTAGKKAAVAGAKAEHREFDGFTEAEIAEMEHRDADEFADDVYFEFPQGIVEHPVPPNFKGMVASGNACLRKMGEFPEYFQRGGRMEIPGWRYEWTYGDAVGWRPKTGVSKHLYRTGYIVKERPQYVKFVTEDGNVELRSKKTKPAGRKAGNGRDAASGFLPLYEAHALTGAGWVDERAGYLPRMRPFVVGVPRVWGIAPNSAYDDGGGSGGGAMAVTDTGAVEGGGAGSLRGGAEDTAGEEEDGTAEDGAGEVAEDSGGRRPGIEPV